MPERIHEVKMAV